MKKLTKPRTKLELKKIKAFLGQIDSLKYNPHLDRVFELFKEGYRCFPFDGANDYDKFITLRLREPYKLFRSIPMGFHFKEKQDEKQEIRIPDEKARLYWSVRPRESIDYYSLCSEPWKKKNKYPIGYPHLSLEVSLNQYEFERRVEYQEGCFVKSFSQDVGYHLKQTICLEPLSPLPIRFFCDLVEPLHEEGLFSPNKLSSGEQANLMFMSIAINGMVRFLK